MSGRERKPVQYMVRVWDWYYMRDKLFCADNLDSARKEAERIALDYSGDLLVCPWWLYKLVGQEEKRERKPEERRGAHVENLQGDA